MVYDIIVIGSGVGALYFGYRALQYQDQGKSILFLTQDHELGGRINSRTTFDACVPWKAESCAARFLPSQPLINKTVQCLNIPSVEIAADQVPVVTPRFPEIIQAVNEAYPLGSKQLEQATSLNTAITLTSNYENVDRYARSVGYELFAENVNLYAFRSESVTDVSEMRLPCGFQSFCNHLYRQWADTFLLITNYLVQDIYYDESSCLYTINNTYVGKKIVYTGTFPQFQKLNTQSSDLTYRRSQIPKLYVISPSFRSYIYFDQPWWGDLLYRFNNHPLMNQVIFYTPNIILVYTLGNQTSNTLQELADRSGIYHQSTAGECLSGNGHHLVMNQWIDPIHVQTFLNYFRQVLPIILNSALPEFQNFPMPTTQQLYSISKVMVSYAEQALMFPTPITTLYPEETYNRLQSYNQFYWISGDLSSDGGGWVEKSMEMVEKYIDEIFETNSNKNTV